MKLIDNKLYREDIKKVLSKLDLSELEGKTILITGGLGLIGSTVADLLIVHGKLKKIIIAGRDIRKFQARYQNVSSVEFIEYDALKSLELPFKPDYVIHSAGIASPELYISTPVETILSNFIGLNELLEFSKEKKVKRLLYVSSSEVYGKKDTNCSFSEKDYGLINIDNIRSSYAMAKKASEMLCKAYYIEYGVESVIVRPGHIYGPSAMRKDKRVSSDFAYQSAEGKNLELHSSGLQMRSYCYSIECAAQILLVLQKGKSTEAYNVGHDEVTTIKDMAQIYANAGGVELLAKAPTEEELKAFNPMMNSSLNNEKIKELGYRDTFSVLEGLTHTVQIIRECLY